MTLVLPYEPDFILGDGSTRRFHYSFDEISEDLISVIIKKTDGNTYIPLFTVDLDSLEVILLDVEPTPEPDDLICIYRNTPEVQDVAFRTLDGYNAQALENILSKIVAMIQETRDVADHQTVRTTFPQRDVSIAELTGENQDKLLYWDNEKKTITPTDFPRQDVVRSVGGLFFRIKVDESTNTPYLEWSKNGVDTWRGMNFADVDRTASEAKDIAEQASRVANDAKSESHSAVEIVNSLKDQTTKNTQDIAKNSVAIGANEAAISENKTAITESQTAITQAQNTADTAVEKTENLQTQIDAISAASDVADVVGTYADLQAYDTSKLTDNAIIKVLNDETQGGASTYYRWTIGE